MHSCNTGLPSSTFLPSSIRGTLAAGFPISPYLIKKLTNKIRVHILTWPTIKRLLSFLIGPRRRRRDVTHPLG
jgi:hypothetical protein